MILNFNFQLCLESESDGESGNEKCVTTLDKNELKVKFINSKKLNEQPDKPQDPKSERNKYFKSCFID